MDYFVTCSKFRFLVNISCICIFHFECVYILTTNFMSLVCIFFYNLPVFFNIKNSSECSEKRFVSEIFVYYNFTVSNWALCSYLLFANVILLAFEFNWGDNNFFRARNLFSDSLVENGWWLRKTSEWWIQKVAFIKSFLLWYSLSRTWFIII